MRARKGETYVQASSAEGKGLVGNLGKRGGVQHGEELLTCAEQARNIAVEAKGIAHPGLGRSRSKRGNHDEGEQDQHVTVK
jgi:hypothetical protein